MSYISCCKQRLTILRPLCPDNGIVPGLQFSLVCSLFSSARILVPVIILGNLLYNLISLIDHEPPVRNSLTKCWTAMSFGHLSLLCASLSTPYKFNSSYSESPSSLSIVFAQAESFGFLLFVFHRLRINLLSLLSLYQQA